jgi:hypothetical protein
MMCYRDRTYCQGPCAFTGCSRQITDDVTKAAERAGLPLAISDFRNTCRDYVPASGEGAAKGGES